MGKNKKVCFEKVPVESSFIVPKSSGWFWGKRKKNSNKVIYKRIPLKLIAANNTLLHDLYKNAEDVDGLVAFFPEEICVIPVI